MKNKLKKFDKEIYQAIINEEKRQKNGIELIPSENYAYQEVLEANGSVLTNKYSEGYPGKRYYGGQEFTDKIEKIAIKRAKKVFKCEHANVQPLSGSPMNQAVYFAFLKPGDTIMGMDLSHGGHLTHGSPVTHMGKIFNFVRYKTDKNGKINFNKLLKIAKKNKPKIILCGYTSYPRDYNYYEFKKIANAVGAIAMADVSHIGGLIAAGVMKNPFDFGFDIMTTTTHKTLRGPRAGLILCKKKFANIIDKSVFPGLQGGPHMHAITAIAVALKKAMEPEFKKYAKQVLKNAKAMAQVFLDNNIELITNGTDNHMIVIDVFKNFGIDGKIAEHILDKVLITVNKQIIPDDDRPAMTPSGIRLGSPAATTRGMKEKEMIKIGRYIIHVLKNYKNQKYLDKTKKEIIKLAKQFPI